MAGGKAPGSAKTLHTVIPGFLRVVKEREISLTCSFTYVHLSLATNGKLPSRSLALLTPKTTCAKLIAGGHGVLES